MAHKNTPREPLVKWLPDWGLVKIMDTDGDSKRRKTRMCPQNLPVPPDCAHDPKRSFVTINPPAEPSCDGVQPRQLNGRPTGQRPWQLSAGQAQTASDP